MEDKDVRELQLQLVTQNLAALEKQEEALKFSLEVAQSTIRLLRTKLDKLKKAGAA